MRHFSFSILFFLIITFGLSFGTLAHASDGWIEFRDEDGVFNAIVPENYKINKKIMRLDGTQITLSSELTASVDQRPFKDIVKQFVIKYDQTLADSLAQDDIGKLITADVTKYVSYYDALGGVLRKQDNGFFAGFPGTEIVISYKDEKFGLQSLRARFIYTDTSKIQQLVIGPDDTMFNFRTKDFFKSLSVSGGRTVLRGNFNDEWQEIKPPSESFTILTPRTEPPFAPYKPSIKAGENREVLSLVFEDPVYDQSLFYNVYSYRFQKPLSTENVQLVLLKNHLQKFGVNPKSVNYGVTAVETQNLKATRMEATVSLAPPKDTYYLNRLKLVAYFYGPFLVVQEMAGDSIHVHSSFGETLMSLIEFKPKRALEAFKEKRFQDRLEDLKSGETPTE